MTAHHTCRDNPNKKRLCPSCLYWDMRPEEGAGPGLGYCSKRDIVTAVRCECEYFEEATQTKVDARNRSLYGEVEDEYGEED